MKKALKIIGRLEKVSLEKKLDFKVIREGEKIIFEKEENQLLVQMMYLFLFVGTLLLTYFQKDEFNLLTSIILIICSIIFLLSYFKGAYQTDNRIEIDLTKGEISINRKSFFGKLWRSDRILKTQRTNKVIKENVPFSDANEKRLLLEIDKEKIPLVDLRDDTSLDQIFLSLNLLVKHQMEDS